MCARERDPAPAVDPAAVLLGTYLFQDLTPAEIEPLARAAEVRRYGPGEHIFDVGDTAEFLYVIVSGEARDSILTLDGDEYMHAMWGPGMVVGDAGFFAPDNSRVMAFIAVQPTVLLLLSRSDVMPFLLRHPAAMRRALENLAATARALTVEAATRSLRSLRDRVLLRLLELADSNPPRADGSAVTPRISQSTLSTMVGVSRENVNRALAALTAAGVVRAESGVYVVVDRARAWDEVMGGGPELSRPNRRRPAERG